MLSTGLDHPFEQGICEPFIIRPVGAELGPVGGCKALVGLLGTEGFLIRGSPHEVSVVVVGLVLHK